MLKDEQILIIVGENVKRLRQAKNWSQHTLSIEADIPKNQVGRIERAEVNTTILTLSKLANALGVKLNSLTDY